MKTEHEIRLNDENRFKVRYTRYEINLDYISPEDFIKYLLDDDELDNALYKIDGVDDVDYNGHFGQVILITLTVNLSDVKNEIISTISKYLNNGKNLIND